jgi:hypothetical protein
LDAVVSAASDEMVAVIRASRDEHGPADNDQYCICGERVGDDWHEWHQSTKAIEALIEKFGEPELDLNVVQKVVKDRWVNTLQRRIVFPWKEQK